MASPSVERMTTLSQEIVAKTKVITDYLTSKGLDAASFDVNGLADFPIPSSDLEPFLARQDLITLTQELHDITLGPTEKLRLLAFDAGPSELSLLAAWDFKVAQAVPLDGMISYEDLSTKVSELTPGLHVPTLNLRRIVRHAMTNRIFTEPKKGFVAHNRASRLMAEDPTMNAWVGFLCGDLGKAMGEVVTAMKKWPGSEESTETGVNLAYNEDMPFFNFIQKDVEFAKRYNLSMKGLASGEGYAMERVIEGYDWSSVPDGGTVVDMGGNQGHVSFALAEAFPKLNFIVQDQAGMRTPETIGTVPSALSSRVTLTTHDFFNPQPVVADVYFFRMIFHGFSDKYCVKILEALTPALRPGAKIVLNDGGLPEPGSMRWLQEKRMRTMDLLMQVTVNAREREPDDWTELFRRADGRYKVLRVWMPEKSQMWFVEAEWTGDGLLS